MIYVDSEEVKLIKVRYMMLLKCKLYISTSYEDEYVLYLFNIYMYIYII